MKLEDMIQAMEGTLLQGSAKAEVQGVSIDSRTIRRAVAGTFLSKRERTITGLFT